MILSLGLSSCDSSSKNKNQVEEFAGIITYKADYIEPNDTTHYHDTLKCYYLNGNILRVHSGANPGKILKDVYIATDNTRYGFLAVTDTVLSFDAGTRNDIDPKFTLTTPGEKLLSHNCSKFTATATHMKHGIPLHTVVEYSYAKGYLPIDKTHFTNCYYDAFNSYTDQCSSFYLNYKFTAFSPDGQIVMGINYRAISVVETHVDPSLFNINKSKVLNIRQP